MYVKIYLLKKTDKDAFKKKNEWQLRDLKILDGVSVDSSEFRMDLDERYSWIVNNVEAKEKFLKDELARQANVDIIWHDVTIPSEKLN